MRIQPGSISISQCKEIFRTNGIIVNSFFNKELFFLYYEDGKFKRETGREIVGCEYSPLANFGLLKNLTLLSYQPGNLLIFPLGEKFRKESIDCFNFKSVVSTDLNNYYYLKNNNIYKNDKLFINEKFQMFWTGPLFGIGIINNTFVYIDLLNKSLKELPIVENIAELKYINCFFSDIYCWVFTVLPDGKRTCYLIALDGLLKCVNSKNPSWSEITGKCAIDKMLIVSQEKKFVCVEMVGNRLAETTIIPNPFSIRDCAINYGYKELFLIETQSIKRFPIGNI